VPLGDVADMADVGAEAALAGDNAAIRRMAARYNAGGDAIVTLAAATGLPEDPLSRLAVQIIRMGAGGEVASRNIDVVRAEGEDDAHLLDRAAAQVLSELRLAWKQETAVEPIAPRDLDVVAVVPDLAGWVAMEQALRQALRVEKITISAISQGRVRLVLSVAGDIEKLRSGLAANGFALLPTGQGYEIRQQQ